MTCATFDFFVGRTCGNSKDCPVIPKLGGTKVAHDRRVASTERSREVTQRVDVVFLVVTVFGASQRFLFLNFVGCRSQCRRRLRCPAQQKRSQ